MGRTRQVGAIGIVMGLILSACGGGGGGAPSPSSSAPPPASTLPPVSDVTITGKVTFDDVPHDPLTHGLDYEATIVRAARGIRIEAQDSAGKVLATAGTDANGEYSLKVPGNRDVKILAQARMIRAGAASWDVSVTDNTNGNALYALSGSLSNTGTADSVRNLHAPSGWDGTGYADTRASAPFAILDPIYNTVQKMKGVDPTVTFPALEMRWSVNNRAVSGDISQGHIGTSSYKPNEGGHIYLLGAANADTDEFDRHVIIHEWAHYFEDRLARTDSVGGSHGRGDKLDPRVAFSEGWGNALSAMITDDPLYRDSSGGQQSRGFSINVESNYSGNQGWYSEYSVQSVIYDVYDERADHADNIALGLGPIYRTMTGPLRSTEAFTTLYSFTEGLKATETQYAGLIEDLVRAQSVTGQDSVGTGETNSGNIDTALPVYKSVKLDGTATEICSVTSAGRYNKLGNRAFLTFDVPRAGTYTLRMARLSGSDDRDPDFIVYKAGRKVQAAESDAANAETVSVSLEPGVYTIDAFDAANMSFSNAKSGNACYGFTVKG